MRLWVGLALAVAWPCGVAFGGDPRTDRDEFQSAYVSQQSGTPSIFGTAPVSHIIPKDNTITFAAAYQYVDVSVGPPGSDLSASRLGQSERLDLTGWSASPYVAFSTKNFGIGFSGEVGRRQSRFLNLPSLTPGSSYGGEYFEQTSTMTYSGLGLSAFYTASGGFLPKFVAPTFILGGKTLNAVQNSSGSLYTQVNDPSLTKYQYGVENYEAGLDVGLHLLKRFSVIPWVDYSTYRVGAVKQSDQSVFQGQQDPQDDVPTQDQNLFWKSSPALNYGVDFAVELDGFSIHLGGLLGLLGNFNKGSDRIQDNSRNVSISLDTKGN